MEPSNEIRDPQPSHPDPSSPPRRGRRILSIVVFGGFAAGAIGFLAGSTMPVADAALHAFARGPGCHGEHARERVGTFVSFAMHRLDASDEQEQRVLSIVETAMDDLEPLRDAHYANRAQLASLLAQPTVDRAAIEDLRVEAVALADDFSRTIAGAVADTAEVLSAQQRIELVEHLERFSHHAGHARDGRNDGDGPPSRR